MKSCGAKHQNPGAIENREYLKWMEQEDQPKPSSCGLGRHSSTETAEICGTRRRPASPPGSALVWKRLEKEDAGQTKPEEQFTKKVSGEEAAERHQKTGREEGHTASSSSHARYGPRCRSVNR